MEKRKNVRVPIRLSGHMSLHDGEHVDTETRDVSLQGAFVERVPTGISDRSCVLTLFADGEEVFSITVDGWVVHENERGCGIEFESMDARDFEAFKAFLETRLPEPQLLQREVALGRVPMLQDWMIS
ncbi:PilZ domain-containing protein [Thioalkalivibrio sp.]|uniref:PilZ domain-containing protein n=1 Tax=Thioalkalivibrio sp. TaxID=2093813 RepID=UPI0039761F18